MITKSNYDELLQQYGINTQECQAMKIQKLKYWQRKMQIGRNWSIMYVISNVVWQTIALIGPRSPLHFKINLAYMGISILTLVMFWLSVYNKKCLNMMFYGMMVTFYRNLFRLFDFENTRVAMTKDTWVQFMCGQILACCLNTVVIHHSFNFTIFKKIVLDLINSSALLTAMYIGSLDSYKDFFDNGFINVFLTNILFAVFTIQYFYYILDGGNLESFA